MKHAIIDIGSNSMRLTVYEVEDRNFRILFKGKYMAGLAGYVEKGCLSEEGIKRAYEGLLEFKNTLESLDIRDNIHVFATASLRNIINTDEAVLKITAAAGFDIDVIGGEEEALLGYTGAMFDMPEEEGAFIDIGGASTEITVFEESSVIFSKSYRIGSLKLYKECVKNILPGKGSVKRIMNEIRTEIPGKTLESLAPREKLICAGGTARSILKFVQKLVPGDTESRIILPEQLEETGEILLGDSRAAADIILKVDPERIHTIIPGYLILKYTAEKLAAKEIIVSSYGVREGYLCRKVLP